MLKSWSRFRLARTLALGLLAGLAGYGLHGWSAEPETYGPDYARDRAEIEDLLARYAFALDWLDPPTYAATFTEDGVLDWAGGVVEGRSAIAAKIAEARDYFLGLAEEDAPLRPARLRHFITNVVIDVQGDSAEVRAFWFEFFDRNPERLPEAGAYGHSEDRLRRENGRWLFASRKIYNEQRPEMTADWNNPAW